MRLGPDTTGLAQELRDTLTETTDDLVADSPASAGRHLHVGLEAAHFDATGSPGGEWGVQR